MYIRAERVHICANSAHIYPRPCTSMPSLARCRLQGKMFATFPASSAYTSYAGGTQLSGAPAFAEGICMETVACPASNCYR